MPLPVIPLLPLLKVVALGSLKVVFLFLGACFVPRLTLRLVIGGSVGMILPVLDWLRDQGRMSGPEHDVFYEELQVLNREAFTRPEARKLLFKLVFKTMKNIRDSVTSAPTKLRSWWSSFRSKG